MRTIALRSCADHSWPHFSSHGTSGQNHCEGWWAKTAKVTLSSCIWYCLLVCWIVCKHPDMRSHALPKGWTGLAEKTSEQTDTINPGNKPCCSPSNDNLRVAVTPTSPPPPKKNGSGECPSPLLPFSLVKQGTSEITGSKERCVRPFQPIS